MRKEKETSLLLSQDRRMTQSTLDYLLARKIFLEQELKNLGEESADGYQRATLHDNPSLEWRKNGIQSELAHIGNLDRVEIIFPRQDRGSVGLGSQVSIDYGDGDIETLTILAHDDVAFGNRSNVISNKSPIGSTLIGRRVGETVVCDLPSGREIRIKIKEIEPGNF